MQVSSRIMSSKYNLWGCWKTFKNFDSTFTLIIYRVVLTLHHFSSLNSYVRESGQFMTVPKARKRHKIETTMLCSKIWRTIILLLVLRRCRNVDHHI